MKQFGLLLSVLLLSATTLLHAQDSSSVMTDEEIVAALPQQQHPDTVPLSYTLTIKSEQPFQQTESSARKSVSPSYPKHYLMFSVGDAFWAHYMTGGSYYGYVPQHHEWFGDYVYESRYVYLPNLSLSYYYSFKPWFELGVEAGYIYSSTDVNHVVDNSHYATFGYHNAYLMAAIRFPYINRKYFGMYSGLGLGLGMNFETYNAMLQTDWYYPAFHVNLLGMRFGNKVYGTLEFGFGLKGYANIGIGTRF